MIAAAQIIFANRRGEACLDWLAEQLPKAGIQCSRTEWRGFTMVVPQLLVGTSPTALTIQVDGDRQYVPGEIAELAEQIQGHLSPHLRQALLSCDTRLDLMSATPAERTVTDREIIVVAQTDMDPAQPEVEKVILSLSAITSGYILDCVNNRFRVPGGPEWMQL